MKISRNKLKEIIRETLTENKEYEQFFQTALDRAGKSIPDMSDDEKKSFFDKIDTAWNGRGEKKEVSEESDSSSADFQEFFKRSLEKAGKSITSMTPDEKEKFFNQIDASWNGKGEKKEVGESMNGECDTCNKPVEEPECEDCGKNMNEAVFVMDERPYGKNGLIIMIQDSGKSISAIFKNKKNADKFNRNDASDLTKLSQLAKKLPFGKAIDESKLNERGEYENQTGIKSSIARSREFRSLFDDSRELRWIMDDTVKVYNWNKGGLIFTNGKHEIVVDVKHPMRMLLPMGPVRQHIKALYNNKTENVNEISLPKLNGKLNIDKYNGVVIYKTTDFDNITKYHLLYLKKQMGGDFVLKTNAGIDLHSSEIKNGSWNGIKIIRESVNEDMTIRRFLDPYTYFKDKSSFQYRFKNIDNSKIKELIKFTKSNGGDVESVGSNNIWGITNSSKEQNQAIWHYSQGILYYGSSDLPRGYTEYIQKLVKESVDNSEPTLMIQLGGSGHYWPWYLQKIDSTHFKMVNNEKALSTGAAMVHHVGQHRGEVYYDDLVKWLHGSISVDKLNGKKYKGNG